jgi:hypothetical protein
MVACSVSNSSTARRRGPGSNRKQRNFSQPFSRLKRDQVDFERAQPVDTDQRAGPHALQMIRGKTQNTRGGMTSIIRFINETGSVLDEHATKAIDEAFEAACRDLDETEQPSVVYEAVARRIIELAKSGERDPNKLRDRA